MKNKLIITASGLVLILIAWACAKTIYDVNKTEKIIPKITTGDPIKYHPISLEGSVEIRATAKESVIYLSNITYNSKNDLNKSNVTYHSINDSNNRVFVLQQESGQTKFNSHVVNEKAELLFFKWGLVVALKSGGNYLFALGDDNDEPMDEVQAFLLNFKDKSFKFDKAYYGFGLAVMPRDFPSLKNYLKERTVTFYDADEALKKRGIDIQRLMQDNYADCNIFSTCTAGGYGASGCSSGSASVACRNIAFNACCTGIYSMCCSEETTPD